MNIYYKLKKFTIYLSDNTWIIISNKIRGGGDVPFYDVLCICKNRNNSDILLKFPFALIIDNNTCIENIIEKYSIFNTKIFFSKCHEKNYVVFPKEKLLFSMNLSFLDIVDITTKLDIKFIFDEDGQMCDFKKYISTKDHVF